MTTQQINCFENNLKYYRRVTPIDKVPTALLVKVIESRVAARQALERLSKGKGQFYR